jgi:hypothetical protein
MIVDRINKVSEGRPVLKQFLSGFSYILGNRKRNSIDSKSN